jgi:hypothetical protein
VSGFFQTIKKGIPMKYSIIFSAVLMALTLSACDRPTVVVPPAAAPAPGPAGPAGATGATGATGAQAEKGEPGKTGDTGATGATGAEGAQGQRGKGGDTVVIVPGSK